MAKVINKVVYNNNTLIDLTQDTVVASKLAQGYTAHSADGAQITGTMPEGGGGEYYITGTTLTSGGQQLDITNSGTAIIVEPITITQNGTTTAPTGKAYSPITVNVSGGSGNTVPKASIDANGNVVFVSSIDVSNIKTIASKTLEYWQSYNTNLSQSLNFTSLTTVGESGLYFAFGGSNITGVSFPSLTTISFSGLAGAFSYSSLSGIVSFPVLTSVGGNCLNSCFSGCTGITEMHFKSSMQSAIEAQTGYSSKFGATNATIYFDLP